MPGKQQFKDLISSGLALRFTLENQEFDHEPLRSEIDQLPGPVLLAEMAAPFEIVTDCPAVREMLPPLPEPGSVPIERLKMPAGEPSRRVPDIEIWSVARMVISPPRPPVLVPLLICPPLPRVRDPVVMEMGAASPQGPVQN